MTNTGKIQVEIEPTLNPEKYRQEIERLVSEIKGLNIPFELLLDEEKLAQMIKRAAEQVRDANRVTSETEGVGKKIDEAQAAAQSGLQGAKDEADAAKKREQKLLTTISLGVQYGSAGLQKISSSSLGFLEDIFGYMKQASPLLQSLESMFNLAIQLFFMPLGTKLADTVLPAVIDLVDSVVEFTEGMEGMTLPEMMNHMLTDGVAMFADFFNNLGDSLETANENSSEGNDLLGSLADLMHTVADLLEDGTITSLIGLVLDTSNLILSNLAEFISLYLGLQAMQIAATIASGFGISGVNLAETMLLSGVIVGGLSWGAATALGFAEGGEVPATPGGQLIVAGEGGQNEYIFPESKLPNLVAQAEQLMDPKSKKGTQSEPVVITNNFYGYNEDEMVERINQTVNTAVSRGRVSGVF